MNPTKINKHFFTFPKLRSLREQWFNAINFNCNETIPYSASKMYIQGDSRGIMNRKCNPQFIRRKTRTFTASMSGFLLQCIVGCICYSLFLVNHLVCEDHFSENCFVSTLNKRLHRGSVPPKFVQTGHSSRLPHTISESLKSIASWSQVSYSLLESSQPHVNSNPLDHSFNLLIDHDHTYCLPSITTERNKSIVHSNQFNNSDLIHSPPHINNNLLNQKCVSSSSTSVPRQGSCNNKQILSKTRNGGYLKKISCTGVSSLTPRKRKLYYCNRVQQGKISKLNKLLSSSKSLCKKLKTLSHSSLLQDIEKHFDATGATFLKSQFVNMHRKNPSWSLDNKVFALALYKRGPKCYRFLSRFIKLPSKSTISKFLQKVPFQTGINMQLFEKLKTRVSKMSNVNKLCRVMFDEISLATNLTYCKLTDSIIGYEDLGTLGRTNSCANHALVFMVQSIYSGWKQRVAYSFTKDTIKSKDLRYLIREVIEQLQLIGITVASTVCDQDPTNRGALKLLKQESSYGVRS
jgi:hypothetical protein